MIVALLPIFILATGLVILPQPAQKARQFLIYAVCCQCWGRALRTQAALFLK
jgi:hypothetical protein